MEQIQAQLRTPNSEYVQKLLSKVTEMDHEFVIDFMKRCKKAWKFLLCTPCDLEDVTTDGLHCTIDSTNNFKIAPSVVFSIMRRWNPGMTSLLLHDSKNLCHNGPQRGMPDFYEETKFNVMIVSCDCFYVFIKSHVIITTRRGTEQDDIILAILYHLFRDDIPVYIASNDKKDINPANIPDLSGMGDTWQELSDVISAGIGEISMSWDNFIKTYSSSTASPLTSLAGGGCASPSLTSLAGDCASPSPTSCFICNSENHRSYQCPEKLKAKSTATTPKLPHDLTKHL